MKKVLMIGLAAVMSLGVGMAFGEVDYQVMSTDLEMNVGVDDTGMALVDVGVVFDVSVNDVGRSLFFAVDHNSPMPADLFSLKRIDPTYRPVTLHLLI